MDLSNILNSSWTKNNVKSRLFCMALFMVSFILGGIVEAKERITVGLVEEVVLLPWGVKLPARIDTGAAQTSLDARDIVIRGKTVNFKLPEKYGGLQLSLPIVALKTIRSAEALEQRPVVMMEFCLGSKHIRTRVNLNDRSKVKYPLLVGRNALKKNFIVDCMKEKCAPPICPEVQNK
ncbi:MAG: RimK/LysX family protein [Pseudomonadota bacterium]